MNLRIGTYGILSLVFLGVLCHQGCGQVKFTSLAPELTAISDSDSDINLDLGKVDPIPDSPKPLPTDDIDFVECDLNSSSEKIILNGVFSTGSNSHSSRVCMTRNACELLVDNYAKGRGCTVKPGPVTTPKNLESCTSVFPGSNGTCHNARVLTDAQVNQILADMAKLK